MGFNIKQTENEKGTVILLHGYGADGKDLEFLAQLWAPYFKDWNFASPDAPIKLSSGYAWFDLESDKWEKGLTDASNQLIDQLQDYQKPLIFVGFSQGGFIAAQLAAYSNLNIQGSISLSSGLIPLNKQPKKNKLYFIHGTNDDVIPQNWFDETIKIGKEQDFNIEGQLIEGMEHEINDKAIEYATIYINQLINPNKIAQ